MQVKPLNRLARTAPDQAKHSSKSKPDKRTRSDSVEQPHSAWTNARGKAYGNQTVPAGAPGSGVRRLNPTRRVPAHRSYPGLAN